MKDEHTPQEAGIDTGQGQVQGQGQPEGAEKPPQAGIDTDQGQPEGAEKPPLNPYGTPPLNPYGTPPLNPYGTPPLNPYYTPYVKPVRAPYAFTPCDAAYACFALTLGFLCWQFELFSNLGAFIVLIAALIGSLMYMNARGVRQSRRSAAVFAVCFIGALPLLLYDSIPIFMLLLVFLLFACFYWIAVSAGNSVEDRVSGFVLADWVNQTFVVPFSNFLGLFVSIKTVSKDSKRGKTVLIGLIGLCVAIPLIIGVTSLLIKSDAGFEKFANDFSELIGIEDIGLYLLKFIGGIPIACYLFGSVCGNLQKRYTNSITKEGASETLAAAHRIPRAAILTPLTVLCVIYIVYIIVMSVYLFSALTGKLPDEWFIYAEYARRGFFELCGVSAINLFLLIFTYSFAKRMAGEYPKAMRFLTGLFCFMTELLIVTGVSRMLLYVDAYGLSRLRVYTLWFLLLQFVVFAILIIWHIKPYTATATGKKPYNAGRPIVIASVCFLLGLCLINTDGLIAKYNVWQYQSGKIRTSAVDTDALADMSDAVLPYLAELRDNSKNFRVSLAARDAINRIQERHEFGLGMLPVPKDRFRDWSIQSALTQKYLPQTQPKTQLQTAGEDGVIIRDSLYSKSLTELTLSGMYLTEEDIASIRSMTNLAHLSLQYCSIEGDHAPLSSLTNLTSLDLRYNNISDLTPLSALTNLKSLELGGNQISDLTPLSALTNLTNLNLQGNQISDIAPLSALTNLTVLDLSYNLLDDIGPLSGLTNLTWLSLRDNQISDIAPLSGLANVDDLSLSGNRISDLTPLLGLVNLIWLDLDRNDISSLAPLSGIPRLTYVNLEFNIIDDWSPARDIRNVQGRSWTSS